MSARWVIAGAFVVVGLVLVIYAMQDLVWPIAPISVATLRGGPRADGVTPERTGVSSAATGKPAERVTHI